MTVSYMYLFGGRYMPTYSELAIIPSVGYTLGETRLFRAVASVGTGVNIRRLKQVIEFFEHRYTTIQRETGILNTLSITGVVKVSRRLYVTGRVLFDHQLTGDPDQGDMGDTGGFNFLLGIRLSF